MNVPLWFSDLALWGLQVALLMLTAGILPRLLQIRQPHVLLVYWRAVLTISFVLPFIQPWRQVQSIAAIAIAPDIAGASMIRDSTSAVTHWYVPSVSMIAQFVAVVIVTGMAARLVMLTLGVLKLREFRRMSSPVPLCSESAA